MSFTVADDLMGAEKTNLDEFTLSASQQGRIKAHV